MTIHFLHCSDLHLTPGILKEKFGAGRAIDSFISHLRERSREKLLDLVFITGDLANRGARAEYQEASEFLKALRSATGVERDRIWIVPGNHDVTRSRASWLQRTLNSPEDSDRFFDEGHHGEGMLPFLLPFEAFNDYAQQELHHSVPTIDVDGTPRPIDVVRKPTILEIDGSKIGILPLNSSWFSRDANDHGKLWIGSKLVFRRTEELFMEDVEFIIALAHHPMPYLHDKEDAKDYLSHRCDLILTGHLHESSIEQAATQAGTTVHLSAGALYQGGNGPKTAYFGEIDLEKGTLAIEPITYFESARPFWGPDVSMFRGETSGTFPLKSSSYFDNCGDDIGEPTFPSHASWTKPHKGWKSAIKVWFGDHRRGAYAKAPEQAIQKLTSNLVRILQQNPSLAGKVQELAEFLLAHTEPTEEHHQNILELLASGLHLPLSHLFMVPAINVVDLLHVEEYSRILLATRKLAGGDIDEAISLTGIPLEPMQTARPIECCIAHYTAGQAYRKAGQLYKAMDRFRELEAMIPSLENYECPINSGLKCMCDHGLIKAELFRGIGVVHRKLNKIEHVFTYFERAIEAVDERSTQLTQPSTIPDTSVPTEKSKPIQRVFADIYFSMGYAYYEIGNNARATELFEDKSIPMLIESQTAWDSPYTRLAILKLLNNDVEQALQLFFVAISKCEQTLDINREASLSCALCALGLAIIKLDCKGDLQTADYCPIELAKKAIARKPPLTAGPLECHISDAKKLRMAAESPEAHALIDDFAGLLTEALEELRSTENQDDQ